MRKLTAYKNEVQGRYRGEAQEQELGLGYSWHFDTQVYLFIVASFIMRKKPRSLQLQMSISLQGREALSLQEGGSSVDTRESGEEKKSIQALGKHPCPSPISWILALCSDSCR